MQLRVVKISKIRTLVYLRDESRREDLLAYLRGISVHVSFPLLPSEPLDFEFVIANSLQDLAAEVIDALYSSGYSRPLILLSDSLLEESGELASLARTIHGAYFTNRQLCSFVALTEKEVPVSNLMSGVIPWSSLTEVNLYEALTRAAARLLLLSTPGKDLPSDTIRKRVAFRAVQTPIELIECFRFRHEIYKTLGYLDPVISKSQLQLDLDSYDGMALHFVARDEETGEIAGTLRAIVPHQPWGLIRGPAGSLKEVFSSHQEWFRSTIPTLPEPELRKRLRDPGPGPLPIVQNMKLSESWLPLLSQVLQGVELSRFIVHPKYRGLGISRGLFHLGLATTWQLNRRLVFAECLPNHIEMYSKFGFKELEGKASGVESFANYHFTPESLFLDIQNGSAMGKIAHYDSELFKLANPALREEQVHSSNLEREVG